MARYLIDSDVLIDYLNGRQNALKAFERFHEQQDQLMTSPINVVEVISGTPALLRPLNERFLARFEMQSFSWEVAQIAGNYRYDFARKGRLLSLADAALAATAKANDLILVTKNTKHYPMKDIELYPVIPR